jgi:hypothetical protein
MRKFKRLISAIVISFFLSQLILPLWAATEISTWAELAAISSGLAGDYVLVNDLDSESTGYDTYASSSANAGAGWSPIGFPSSDFTGTFDGAGYVISDIYVSRSGHLGLFRQTGTDALVKDLGIEDITVINGGGSGKGSGALVGYGLAGYGSVGGVYRCYATGTITNVTAGSNWTGGMFGSSRGKVFDCYTNCTVTGVSRVGGFAGHAEEGSFNECFSYGAVSGSGSNIGGLVGSKNIGTANYSFWDTQTSGQASSALGTGKTTAQMKDIDTFIPVWDIVLKANHDGQQATAVWYIDDGNDYPRLWFEYDGGGTPETKNTTDWFMFLQ